jgi:hypothetical protein
MSSAAAQARVRVRANVPGESADATIPVNIDQPPANLAADIRSQLAEHIKLPPHGGLVIVKEVTVEGRRVPTDYVDQVPRVRIAPLGYQYTHQSAPAG